MRLDALCRLRHRARASLRGACLSLLLLLGLCMAPLQATDAESTSAESLSPGIEALTHFFSDIQTFKAHFSQVVLDENLNALDEGRGMVWIKRPGRFRWDYDPPEAQSIVGDGERVWLHDIDLEQVTVRAQARALGRTPAILLAGIGDLEQNYAMEDIGAQGPIDWVNLIPDDPQSGFTEVRIGFENHRLRLMELIDTLDQRTRISFTELQENTPVADALFEFTPPAGIDIIDQTQPASE